MAADCLGGNSVRFHILGCGTIRSYWGVESDYEWGEYDDYDYTALSFKL